jgi:PKD repeat protein
MKRHLISTLIILLSCCSITSYGQQKAIKPNFIGEGVYWGETPNIRDLPPLTEEEHEQIAIQAALKEYNRDLEHRSYPYKEDALPKGPDPAWQKENGTRGGNRAPVLNVPGQNSPYFPPDCNGAVGPNHYMQTVNTTYAIYDKTGTLVYGPYDMNTLFGSVPGANCNDGDPIILYDEMAERWLAAEFSLCGSNDRMLVAVSTSNDPTGTWHQYSFDVDDMPDYEKLGVWQDGYYMGTNTYGGNDIYVMERDAMLIGASATIIGFDNPNRPNSGFHCVPPVDNDGDPAPAGEPGLFITINDDAWGGSATDQLWIFELDVDWATPMNSSFIRVQQLNVDPFDANFGTDWENIPQPGTSQKLDAIPQVIMNRPQYRNFGSYETIICCHTVDVDGTDHAGVRWYELRRSGGGNWTARQQGTYAPDIHHRWMGGIALNGSGQIALGYSISSTTEYPGIRYCGQSETEYLNASGIMDISEDIIWTGTHSQTQYERWGDYTNMSVDPTNDYSFWFSTEYINQTQRATRIAVIEIGTAPLTASFTSDITSVCKDGAVNFTDQTLGAPTSWEWSFPGGTPSTSTQQSPTVTYDTQGTYDVTLIVSDGTNTDTITETDYITVKLIVADFTGSPQELEVNNPVTFTDMSQCSPTTWTWYFPGGTPSGSTSQNPVITYSNAGVYDVTLVAENALGNDSITKPGFITVNPCTYCESTFANTTRDWITNVTFNTINNSSGQGGISSYQDFTNISTIVEPGISYDLSVSIYVSQSGRRQECWAFIDWNNDCDFDDPGEEYDLGSTTGTGTCSLSITVPVDAYPGQKTMRIVEQYFINPSSCNSANYGETEDYSLQVADLGTPGLWCGDVSNEWNDGDNWENGSVPASNIDVEVPANPAGGNFPQFSGSLTLGTDCKNLTIGGNAILSVTGNLVVPDGFFIQFTGGGEVHIGGNLDMAGEFDPGNGTMVFDGTQGGSITGNFNPDITQTMELQTFDKGMDLLTSGYLGPDGDDGVLLVPIGFTFNYLGNDYTSVKMCTNGWLSLSWTTASSGTNPRLFNSDEPNNTIAPWWDDLEDDFSATCRYTTEGTAPDRVFVAEWYNVLTYYSTATSRISFQVRLYETSNIIEFHYGDLLVGMFHSSEGASIGIEDETGGPNHFIEATTGSNTTGVTDLKAQNDWPDVNYRFVPITPVIEFQNVEIDKPGATLNAMSDIDIDGELSVKPGTTFTIGPDITINVKGTQVLSGGQNGESAETNEKPEE